MILLKGIIKKKNVDGWNLVYEDKNKPVEFLIYAVNNFTNQKNK